MRVSAKRIVAIAAFFPWLLIIAAISALQQDAKPQDTALDASVLDQRVEATDGR